MTKFLNNADIKGYIAQTAVTSYLLKADSTGRLVAAIAGTDYQAPTTALLPSGGTAGQILAKIDGANYNTQWIDNYTPQVKHDVKLGAALSKGTPVYVSSANGTNMIVSAASNASEATSSKTLGLLETGGVTNDIVKVITEGLLAGLDTSTATAGDPVWLGPNGTLLFGLANKPSAPVHMVSIGIVTRVQSVNGEIFVKVQNGFELDELHNVALSSVADGQGLFYESATSLWKNKTIASILGYTPANGANYLPLSGGTISGDLTISSTNPRLYFTDTDNNPDYFISNTDGTFTVYDVTNSVGRFKIYSGGNAEFTGSVTTNSTFNITNGLTLFGNHISTQWYNGVDGVFVNYVGYNGGTTQFRNFYVYDGKQGVIATFDGSAKSFTLSGNLSVNNGANTAVSLNGSAFVGVEYSRASNIFGYVGTENSASGGMRYNSVNGNYEHTFYTNSVSSFKLLSTRQVQFTAYTTSSSFSGTAAGYLAFDSSGNVITVAGVAATDSTKLPFNGVSTRFTGDVNTLGLSGTTGVYNLGVATNAPSTYGTLLGFWNTDISTQLYLSYNGSAYWRPSASNTFVGAAWRTFLDSSNYNSYALPLSGGTMSGALVVSAGDRGFEVNASGGISLYSNEINAGALGGTGTIYLGWRRTTQVNVGVPMVLSSSISATSGSFSGPVTITGNGSYLGDWGYKTLELNDAAGYSGIFFKNGANIWLFRRNGADNGFDFAYSTNASGQGTGTFTQQGKWTSAGDLFVRGQVYVGGNGSSTGTQLVYNSGTWGINVTGNANNITQYTINQSLGTGNGPTFADVYTNGWFRNNNNLQGLYSQANNIHFYANSAGYWNVTAGGRANGGIKFFQDHETTLKGYVYWDGSGFGLLNNQGGWSVLAYQGASYGGELRGTWSMGGNTIITSANIGSQSANYANTAGYIPTSYAGGVQSNPQVYFGQAVGVKVAMTGSWSTWSDTLWINGYAGGDVLQMCALHTLRNGQPRMAISVQASNSTSYGSYYEFITTWNIASQTVANTTSISSAVGGSYNWTGVNYFKSNLGGYCGSLSNPSLQANSDSNNSAFLSFHKGGYYAVNMGLDADNVLRIGGWSAAANRWQLDMSGNQTVAGSMYASYFYGSGSIRCGDMWGGAGLYRPSGDMVFGTEAANWVFSSQANTRAYFASGDGNLWMQWSGEWLSTTLGRKHQDGANPSYGTVYASNWFRSTGNTGWYNNDYGQGLRQVKGGNSTYGNIIAYGENYNGWSGFVTDNSTRTAFMQNSSGDHGFFQDNNYGWALFFNRGNACWGIGTDNTYSGDGFRCIKYGSSQYGWTTWSDRRAKENISNITGALDKVLNMRGVYFNYISDEAKNKRVGFIAQELEDVLPEAVRYAEEIDEYNVEYAQIVSVLAEAIKEQNIKIQSLESQLQTLLN